MMDVHTRRVLVVEDDDAIRTAVRMLLEDEGYAVQEAIDGAAALALLRASPERMVVLLDLLMPGVDGLAVLRTLADESDLATRHACVMDAAKTIPPPEVADLLSRLHVPYLTKPFDIDELLAVVAEAADRLG
jgi:two-component system, OmpR family, response regulator MtrA